MGAGTSDEGVGSSIIAMRGAETSIISITSPLLTLDLRTVDLPLATTMIQNYVLIVPEQIVGFVIGSVVTGIIHIFRSILEHFDIQIR